MQELLKNTEQFVSRLLQQKLPSSITFHTLHHTYSVVNACKEIGRAENLEVKDMNSCLLAAWFHDTGYLYAYEGHEECSQAIARKYFSLHKVDLLQIKKINRLIEKTKKDKTPESVLEEVIKDADHYHLAESNYLKYLDDLRFEWQIHRGLKLDDKEWVALNLNYLKQHHYFSDYGSKVLEKKKQKNIANLKSQLSTLS